MIWKDTDCFRKAVLGFIRDGVYCEYAPGTTDYREFWDEELRRCREGYMVKGRKVTGNHYFYLNYCRILRVTGGKGRARRKQMFFPDFWDMDYEYFWWVEIARFGVLGELSQCRELLTKRELENVDNGKLDDAKLLKLKEDVVYNRLGLRLRTHPDWLDGGHHMIVAKARRKGFSYKNTAMMVNIYNTIRNSQCVFGVAEKDYADQGMGMVSEYLGFLNEHTAWGKRREFQNTKDHKRASFKKVDNGMVTESGYMSEIICSSFMNNTEATRGKSPYLMLYEEAGTFPALLDVWAAAIPSMEDGDFVTGQSVVFGCVCAGTKVWTNDGRLVNIENLNQEDGILGYIGDDVSEEPISYMQEKKKKPCYRITTANGTVIECSEDHPILSRGKDPIYRLRKYINGDRRTIESFPRVDWKMAANMKVGDKVMLPVEVSVFGKKHNPHARLIGLLIGDGCYGHDKTPVLSNCDKDINDYVYSNYDCVTERQYITKTNEEYKETRIRNICGILREAGIYGQTKGNKTLPVGFDQYDKESFCELIGGLFDTDGYVYVNHGIVKINLSQAYKPILDSIKLFLIKIGVHCNISYIKPYEKKSGVKDKNGYYRLTIDGNSSVKNFHKNIRLLSGRKQGVLDKCVELNKGNEYSDMYVSVLYDKHEKKAELIKYYNIKSEKVVSVEYIGEQYVYNLTAESTHTYLANNIITHNTGGKMSSKKGEFSKMFYNPMFYNIMPFENIWDDGQRGSWCGFFFPAHWNYVGMMDDKGNSDFDGAMRRIIETRRQKIENAVNAEEYQKYVIEYPICPQESFMSEESKVFNIPKLHEQLKRVVTEGLQQKKGICVSLKYVNDGKEVRAMPLLSGEANPITEYDVSNRSDLRGCPIIYEYPINEPPRGLYKIGYDPYRQDESSAREKSLAAIIVYKGSMEGEKTRNIVVAEYVGRPETCDECDEVALKLAILYNAEVMYENDVRHTEPYFERRHKLQYLALQPINTITSVVKNPNRSRKYGCSLGSRQMKDAGEKYLKKWLTETIGYDEEGNEVTTVDRIYSVGLLQELIRYYRDGNFDRVCAMFQIMFQLEDEELGKEYSRKESDLKTMSMELENLKLFRRGSSFNIKTGMA